MLKVAIIGASGYTGFELIRLSVQHPQIELVAVSSEKFTGKAVGEVFPSLGDTVKLTFHALSEQEEVREADFVFSALPHSESMGVVPRLIEQGKKVVDLSADFRLRTADLYEQWYKKHTAPALLKEAVYGLPEVYREKIRHAQLVANPGCYPTAVLLALIPAVQEGLIDLKSIIIDAKSGVSGAGRSPVLNSLFAEANEGVKPYKIGAHQHTPEIEQELGLIAQQQVSLLFTPHLMPMNRGILITAYATPKTTIAQKDIFNIYHTFYQNDRFVRVCPIDTVPSTQQVKGSNYCDIGIIVDAKTNRLILIAAIDNLVKGASGQAIQNMNIMAGLEEDLGITQLPLFP
jgi:N-acetyl-gamma-glutamyl-phosphate reductase